MLDALADLDLEVSTGTALSSVTAVLRGARPGPAVLLRGDMDALPVTEDSGEPFASEHAGVMHACGHDLHVAGLVGAARLLAARRDEIAGSVVFMFQPGEEGDGGAQHMIDEGVLDAAGERVVAAYGVHVAVGAAAAGRRLGARPGTAMAARRTPCGSPSTVAAATARRRTARSTRCPWPPRSCSLCRRWSRAGSTCSTRSSSPSARSSPGSTDNVIPASAELRDHRPHLLARELGGRARRADPAVPSASRRRTA